MTSSTPVPLFNQARLDQASDRGAGGNGHLRGVCLNACRADVLHLSLRGLDYLVRYQFWNLTVATAT